MSDAASPSTSGRFFARRVAAPLLAFLKQGTTPEKLALCVALGMVIGIIPALGVTTVLCALVALVLRLNQPAIQLVNYLMYPLQLSLVIPFLKAGEYMNTGRSGSLLSASMLLNNARENPLGTISTLWNATLYALLLWFVLAPFLAVPAYLIALQVFRRWRKALHPADDNLPVGKPAA